MEGKKQRKFLSSYSILFILIVIVGVCTWFIPAGQYNKDEDGNFIVGSYHRVERSSQGIWDMFIAPVKGLLGTDTTAGAIEVSLYILVIGGFLGVVTKTGAIDRAIANIMKKRKGKEESLIPILMIVFALGGSTYGMGEETIAFYPLLLPIMIVAGFDTIASASIILLGAGIGCLASTINPFATGIASSTIGISVGEGIGSRIVIFIINIIFAIYFVRRYAIKVKNNPQLSYVAYRMPEDKEFFSQKKLSEETLNITENKGDKFIVWVFILTFVIMVISLIPWTQLNSRWTFFETFAQTLNELPILSTILGSNLIPFGDWYFNELSMLFLAASVVIFFLSKMQEETFVNSFIDGARDLLGVALIVGLARGIQVIMTDGNITSTILYWGESALTGMPKVLFAILVYIFYIPMSFLIPSTSGLAAATMGIIGPMANFSNVPAHVVVTAYQIACGIVNLITPTSGIIIGALSISRIPYNVWFKYIYKFLIALVILNGIIIAIISLL